MTKFTLLIAALAALSADAFVIGANKQNAPRMAGSTTSSSSSSLNMGLISDLQLIFSEEGKANRAAAAEKEKREMEEAQLEILERRVNPEMMEEYERGINQRRTALMKEKEVYKFQNEVKEGVDPLDEWKQKRAEGKIVVGEDLERDPSSERLGSEGLQEVRVDERMPYIDQGYVDEGADVMGNVSLVMHVFVCSFLWANAFAGC